MFMPIKHLPRPPRNSISARGAVAWSLYAMVQRQGGAGVRISAIRVYVLGRRTCASRQYKLSAVSHVSCCVLFVLVSRLLSSRGLVVAQDTNSRAAKRRIGRAKLLQHLLKLRHLLVARLALTCWLLSTKLPLYP